MKLALKYRPRDFPDIVGQKAISVILNAMVTKQALSQVLLFTGPSGVGKTSTARIIAAKLNPDAVEDVHNGTHPAVLEIDAASNGSVEAIRTLKKSLRYVVPGHRVIIIDEAHAMSDEAKAALLNLLEFPVPNVTIILITTEFHNIPNTVRHRCDRYDFKRASIEDISLRLRYVAQQEHIEVSDDLINLLAQRSEGSYRESLMLLDQIVAAGISTLEQYNELQGEVDFGPTLVKSTLAGPIAAVAQLETTLRYTNVEDIVDRSIETLRDLMILKGGLQLEYTGIALEARQDLAFKLSTEQILKAMRIIWDLQTKLSNTDPIRGLQMVFSLMGEVLQVQKYTEVAAVKTSAPLSLAQMQKRAS